MTHEENATLPDLQPREWASVVPLCAMAIVMGVFPTLFLTPMEPAVQRLVAQVQSVQPVRVRATQCKGQESKCQTGQASRQRPDAPWTSNRSTYADRLTFAFCTSELLMTCSTHSSTPSSRCSA